MLICLKREALSQRDGWAQHWSSREIPPIVVINFRKNTIIPGFEVLNGSPSKLFSLPSDAHTCFCFSIALDKTNNNNRIIVISPIEDWNELVAELRLHTVTLCWFGTLFVMCVVRLHQALFLLALSNRSAMFPSAGRVGTGIIGMNRKTFVWLS